MEIGIKVIAENIRSQVVRHANSCFFTMVAVNDEGKPTAVPTIQPNTPDEHRRFAAGKLRRQLRQELEQRFKAIQAAPTPAPQPPATPAGG